MPITRSLAIVLLLIPVGLVLAGVTELLERLRIDHSVLVATERDFRDRRDRGTLRGAEAGDYAAYVARLRRQVIEDCAALARSQAELPLPGGLPCPSAPPAVPRVAAIDQQAERTAAERVATLDAELAAGLGEYDELLLREQERVRAARPRAEEAAGGAGQGRGGAGGGDGTEGTAAGGQQAGPTAGEAAAGTDAGTAQGSGGSRSPTGARGGPGTQQQGRSGGSPPDIPDGSDDDVVARQLREAAEKETDPVLKKKLWEEYRKYKQGTR